VLRTPSCPQSSKTYSDYLKSKSISCENEKIKNKSRNDNVDNSNVKSIKTIDEKKKSVIDPFENPPEELF
jgi:hypothetical protein